jgi:uncharacterized protein (DUF4415 family)
MSTDKDFDYENYYATTKPDPDKLVPSQEARARRRDMAKQRITIRIDHDILERFKHMANEDGYQTLINHALRQWLEAQSVQALLREELPDLILQAIQRDKGHSAA